MRNSINFLTVDCFSFAISLTPLFNQFNNQYSPEKMINGKNYGISKI